MCAVNVGIGHNDDAVVTEFADFKLLADVSTKRDDE
jgi:hypothetical protein